MSEEISITRQNVSTQKPTQPTFPTEIIDLPSQGHFYPPTSKLSSGHIEVKLMTAREEDILSSPNLLKKGLAIEKLLESLVVDKDINLDELLIGDKNALIYSVRRLAYGDSYGPLEITCPKCTNSTKQNIDLSEIKYKEIELGKLPRGVNEFEYVLPASKIAIKFKLLTAGDEKQIERDIEGFAKIKKDSSSEITTRLKYMILSVNGETDKAKVKSFIDNQLLARDSSAFRQYAKSFSPDVDSRFEFNCPECSNQERVAVPMTVSFFGLTPEYKVYVQNIIFDLCYHGNGFTPSEVYCLPIHLRNFYYKKLIEVKERENKQSESKPFKGKIDRPSFS